MNLLLIPRFGATGAAMAAFTSNALLTIIGYWFVRRAISLDGAGIGKIAAKIAISAFVMGIAVRWVSGWAWHDSRLFLVLFSIAAGAISYAGMLIITKTITLKEIVHYKKQVL